MSVLVQLPDGQKTHYVQEPDGVRNLHMQVPDNALFEDALSELKYAAIGGEKASQQGAWANTPLYPNSVGGSTVNPIIRSLEDRVHGAKPGRVDFIEALPGTGLSFNYNKLKMKCGYWFRDGTAAQNGTIFNIFNNSFSINFFCAPGKPYSGVSIFFSNPTLALGHKLQIISYDAISTPTVQYASGDTEIPTVSAASGVKIPLEITLERLPGNKVEISVSISNAVKVNALQFAVDSVISKQNSILFGFTNYELNGDSRIYGPLIIDNV
jgi:hypothetical protein